MNRRAFLSTTLLGTVGTGCLRLTGQGTETPRGVSANGKDDEPEGGFDPTRTTQTGSGALELEQLWSDSGLFSRITVRRGGFYVDDFSRLVRYTKDGRVTWKTPEIGKDSPHHYASNFAFTDSTVCVGTATDEDETTAAGELRAYNREDGSLRWSLTGKDDDNHHDMEIVGATGDGLVLGVSQDDGAGDRQEPIVYAVNEITGDRRWTITELPNTFVVDLVIHDESLYIGTIKGLYGFGLKGGEKRSTHESIRTNFAGMALEGDILYTPHNQIKAFNLRTGETLWKTEIVSTVKAGPTVAGGQVFVGTESGHLVALDVGTGNQHQLARTRAKIKTDPIPHNGYVWSSDETGNVYAHDRSTGNNVLTLEPWDDNDGSRPIGLLDTVILVSGVPSKAFEITTT